MSARTSRQHCGQVASWFRVKMDLGVTTDTQEAVKKYPACLMEIKLPGTPMLHRGKAAYTSVCVVMGQKSPVLETQPP